MFKWLCSCSWQMYCWLQRWFKMRFRLHAHFWCMWKWYFSLFLVLQVKFAWIWNSNYWLSMPVLWWMSWRMSMCLLWWLSMDSIMSRACPRYGHSDRRTSISWMGSRRRQLSDLKNLHLWWFQWSLGLYVKFCSSGRTHVSPSWMVQRMEPCRNQINHTRYGR